MKLNSDLATEIINKTMPVLGKNINIMNEVGIIIGSGNKDRIDTYHEVAEKVIGKDKTYIINQKESNIYQGVKAGINLPIKFNNEIIGVVGITGKAEEVSGYGKLVKNMVELILQQKFLQREIELENRAKENFYQQLLSNSINDEEMLQDRIDLLEINTDISRVVILIQIFPFNNRKLAKQVDYLKNTNQINNNEDILLVRGENIVLIKTLSSNIDYKQNKEIIKTANKIKDKSIKEFESVKLGISSVFNNLTNIFYSYKEAKHALKIANKVYNKKNKEIYYSKNLGFDYFLPFFNSFSMSYYFEHLFDCNIIHMFEETRLGETINTLVNNDLNITKAAEELYVHRNTLLYRIKKIKECTGFDLKNAEDLFTLLFVYHFYLYYK